MPDFVMHRNEKLDFAFGLSKRMAAGDTLSNMAVTIWLGSTDKSGSFTIGTPVASTTLQTDLRGVEHEIGQAVVVSIEGSDPLTAVEHDIRVEATIVETGEKLIAQDSSGNPPTVLITAFGEA